MKKILFIAFLMFLSSAAYSEQTYSDNYYKFRLLIESRSLSDRYNRELFRGITQAMPWSERYALYSLYKKNAGLEALGGCAVNCLLPGLGIGNFIIGDTRGGWITLIGSLSSLALVYIGEMMYYNSYYSYSYTGSYYYYNPAADYVSFAGVAGYIFFCIRGLITPFTYMKNYNQDLLEALSANNMTAGLDARPAPDVVHITLFTVGF